MSNEKFETWEDLKKELNISSEQQAEIKLEVELIQAAIDARKNANLTQRELSEMSGIKQPNIAKIENLKRSPRAITLIKMLVPLGYTLKVVPLNKNMEN